MQQPLTRPPPDIVDETITISDDNPWSKIAQQAIDDWEAEGGEEDWWGTYPSEDGDVDAHIDFMPGNLTGATRRALTIYRVEWQGASGRTRLDQPLVRATIDFDPC